MIPTQFLIETQPVAELNSQVTLTQARFTVLTSRLIRMEYNPDGIFEDRPSQVFWYRKQPVPKYELQQHKGGSDIITEHIHLTYVGGRFAKDTLFVSSKHEKFTWHFGDEDRSNLGGTTRTLDGVCGRIQLEKGLMSRDGWTVVDDSHSLVFDQDCWLVPRNTHHESQDVYFFGYGHDYLSCLRDYSKVSGSAPVLPRWALGNWWSRFWSYSQDELSELMLDFKAHQVPIAVCITDMDWHLEGWTGYTWNRELFSDPPGYLKFLHSLGLHTALNLHPANGVHPHEEMYAEMARAMGVNPSSKRPVEFDIENPAFVKAYFEVLHHPKEEEGVDFWWVDWQQGNPSKLPGLDILWWVNHLHYLDLGRESQKRPFIFSRWGGLGNHRYPIGFSGDTVVSWNSLAFQPYFTATAANVNYGWWSHDIGGHMHGIEDGELYTRWVQFGVFSPILRLHSTKNPFLERRPWGYDSAVYHVSQYAMQLRHALIPYLYSMSWRNHIDGIPPILPMYYLAPDIEDAYACPNQYAFGSELVVAPIITPHDPDTRLARQVIWLPAGDWYGFFTGHHYSGGGWQAIYGDLETIPLFARAGAIIPLGPLVPWGGLENPNELIVHIFPGASNCFELYEDDGCSNEYQNGQYAITNYRLDWSESTQSFFIESVKGRTDFIPAERKYSLIFHSVTEPRYVEVFVNGKSTNAAVIYSSSSYSLTIKGLSLRPADRLEVRFQTHLFQTDWRSEVIDFMLKHFYLASDIKHSISTRLDEIIGEPQLLAGYLTGLTRSQIRAFIEVITGCGVEHIVNAGEELLILWNRYSDAGFQYSIASEDLNIWDPQTRFSLMSGQVDGSQIFRPAKDFPPQTVVSVHYQDLLKIVMSFKLHDTDPMPQTDLF